MPDETLGYPVRTIRQHSNSRLQATQCQLLHQVSWEDPGEVMLQGASKLGTRLIAGPPGGRIRLLENDDRAKYHLGGIPSLFFLHQTPDPANPRPVRLLARDLSCEGQEGKGYDGISYGGVTRENLGIHAFFHLSPGRPINQVNNFKLTKSGVTPLPVLAGDTNILDVEVRGGMDGTGTLFTEGAGNDYTVNNAVTPAEIIPTAGSAIPDGDFFVRYDPTESSLDISPVFYDFENVRFLARKRPLGSTVDINVENALLVDSSSQWRIPSGPSIIAKRNSILHVSAITEKGVVSSDTVPTVYANLTYDSRDNRPMIPINAVGQLRVCDLVDMGQFAIQISDNDGNPINGGNAAGYVYGPNTTAQTFDSVSNCRFIRCAVERHAAFDAPAHYDFCSAHTGEFVDNVGTECGSLFGTITDVNTEETTFQRRAGWVGEEPVIRGLRNKSINQVSYAASIGILAAEAFFAFRTGRDPAPKRQKLREHIFADNDVQFAKGSKRTSSFGQFPAISLIRMDGGSVARNKISSDTQRTGNAPAIELAKCTRSEVSDNDTSGYPKQGQAAADVHVDIDCTDCIVTLKEADALDNDGTRTVINFLPC